MMFVFLQARNSLAAEHPVFLDFDSPWHCISSDRGIERLMANEPCGWGELLIAVLFFNEYNSYDSLQCMGFVSICSVKHYNLGFYNFVRSLKHETKSLRCIHLPFFTPE